MGKLEWLGYNLVKVIWAQYINVTDSHVAIANAAPTHCARWQKLDDK